MGNNAGKTKSSVKPKLSTKEVRRLTKHVSFSEDEIEDWYREFTFRTRKDSQGELFLSEEEFVRVYNSVFPGKGDQFAQHVFRTFDRNQDNKVTFQEFLIGMSVSGSMNMEKKLQWAFQLYDVGQRGYITREGMTEIVKAVFRMVGPMQDGDDTLTPEDLTEQFFRDLDKDGDDILTWQEFRDGAMKYPVVVNLLQCAPPDDGEETVDVDVKDGNYSDQVFSTE